MNRRIIILLTIAFSAVSCSPGGRKDASATDRLPLIKPDYTGITVPSNIAPLNFELNDSSSSCMVVVSGGREKKEFSFNTNKVIFPERKWKKMLLESRGRDLEIAVTGYGKQKSTKYKPFAISVSEYPVDEYLVYRKIMPGFQNWNQMGIYQRSMSDFRVGTIIDSRIMPGTCMNCHSFAQNDPSSMLFHLRESLPGTVLVQNGNIRKINTKTGRMFGNAAFPFWHPSRKYIAFSVNKVNQVFHAAGPYRAAALDLRSDIFIYDIEKNEMTTSKALSAPGKFESFPCFSPDGRTLYFCSADSLQLPQKFKKVKYSLCSVSFDPATGAIGEKADTLISGPAIGKSIAIPRVSPDGRFLMFVMADYGCFPSYNPEADLYLLDLRTGKYKALDRVNSDDVDSYFSWSSDSKWVVFTSRRGDRLYAKPYFFMIDDNGNTSKPFLLPQKDPDFYDEYLFSFNVPELVKSKVLIDPYKVRDLVRKTPGVQVISGSSH